MDLKALWQNATPAQKKKLADDCGTTVGTLHQAAHAYRTGGVPALSPELARSLEKATGGRLRRGSLCRSCGACDLAQKTE
jgi:hypothetical protein